jgi:hypothetical protein
MKRVLTGVLLLAVASRVCAQEAGLAQEGMKARTSLSESSGWSVNLVAAEGGSVAGGEASAAPEPAAKPKSVFGTRDDYRWQLGAGVEYFRFRSKVFTANMVGMNTTVTYFTNSWFAVEGNLVTGFASAIYTPHGLRKLFAGNVGMRIGGRRAHWEPFVHGMVGGSHLQPQTEDASRVSLMAQGGGGVDYRVNSRLSWRVEGDWAYTQYFGQTQNNFQGVTGIVMHF